MSHVQFLTEFVRNPARTGAVTASSRELAYRISAGLDLPSALTVVELGPGTGAFTRQALRRLAPDGRYLGVELNGTFVRRLREELPRIDVVQASAVHLPDLLQRAGLPSADAVLSGLPWAAFSSDLQAEILDAVVAGLAPSGRFATFAYTYSAWIPSARRFARLLRDHFDVVHRTPVVWRNVPPAFVYYCRMPRVSRPRRCGAYRAGMAARAEEIEVGGRTVRVSNPEKIYFPERGLTKLDVVRYFLAVGDGILGALFERPTTLERWPSGVFEGARLSTRMDNRGDAFYQKRVPKGAPDYVSTARIAFPSGRPADEVCPTELAVVAWAANLGTLTFHPWPVSRSNVDNPDQLRIDLDPQPGTDFRDAARVAPHVRALLQEFGLDGVPKTSGGRGMHIYVPIEPRWDFVEARRALIALGRELERRAPDQVTMSWWKEERGERIFIDYNQMCRDRTIASAYSVRPNPRARVSAPLRWEELDSVEPDDFDVLTMPDRFASVGDLHAPTLGEKSYSIEPLLELSAKHEKDGMGGEMPYPPDYPKMPGEPPRVQPSKKNPANWTDESE